jgi:mRNA interferase MazF
MTLKKGDIVLVNFPFTDLSQTKLRPALLLLANEPLNEFTLCFISSQNIQKLTPEEFAIHQTDPEFSGTGLKTASKIRISRLITLQRQLLVRRLGSLGERQMQQLNALMRKVFEL